MNARRRRRRVTQVELAEAALLFHNSEVLHQSAPRGDTTCEADARTPHASAPLTLPIEAGSRADALPARAPCQCDDTRPRLDPAPSGGPPSRAGSGIRQGSGNRCEHADAACRPTRCDRARVRLMAAASCSSYMTREFLPTVGEYEGRVSPEASHFRKRAHRRRSFHGARLATALATALVRPPEFWRDVYRGRSLAALHRFSKWHVNLDRCCTTMCYSQPPRRRPCSSRNASRQRSRADALIHILR
jgi:hypothetical protein